MDDALVESWMVELAGRTAEALERLATERLLPYVNERDHLQPTCSEAARQLAKTSEPSPDVRSQGNKFVYADFPKLGGVDIVVAWSDQAAALELKCGSHVVDCAWDAVKLSFMLARDEFALSFLLAGAPASRWRSRVPGAELFADQKWAAEDVRSIFAKDFTRYERQGGYRPVKVPGEFETRYLGVFPLSVGITPWELRLARVMCDCTAWFDWAPFLPQGGISDGAGIA